VYGGIANGQLTLRSSTGLYTATLTLVPAPGDHVTLAKYSFNEAGTADTAAAAHPTSEGAPGGSGTQHAQHGEAAAVAALLHGLKGVAEGAMATVSAIEADIAHGMVKQEEEDTVDTIQPPPPLPSQPEAASWRWRLLSFDLLPGAAAVKSATGAGIPALLPPHRIAGLQQGIEARMWAAADVASLVKQGRGDLVTLPAAPATRDQRTQAQRELDASHRGASSAAATATASGLTSGGVGDGSAGGIGGQGSLGTGVDDTQEENKGPGDGDEQGGDFPAYARHPLECLHSILQGVAGRLVLGVVVLDEGKKLEAEGWRGRVKVGRVPLGTGVR
jgi:hypothetical protein